MQVRMLETELSRVAAQRDLFRKVAFSAEANLMAEEDRATDLEIDAKVGVRKARSHI